MLFLLTTPILFRQKKKLGNFGGIPNKLFIQYTQECVNKTWVLFNTNISPKFGRNRLSPKYLLFESFKFIFV